MLHIFTSFFGHKKSALYPRLKPRIFARDPRPLKFNNLGRDLHAPPGQNFEIKFPDSKTFKIKNRKIGTYDYLNIGMYPTNTGAATRLLIGRQGDES